MQEKTINLTVPQSWNELSFRQAGEIFHLLHHSKKITDAVKLEMLIHLFLDDQIHNQEKLNDFHEVLCEIPLNPVENDSPYMAAYLDFIFKDLKFTKFPEFVEVQGNKFYGPDARLSNLTIEELSFADHIFFNWITTKKNIELDRLVTVLFREKTTIFNIHDNREPFSRHRLTQRGAILPNLDDKMKLAIGYAYKGSRDLMFSKFKILFPKTKQSFHKKGERKPVKYKSFNAMINSMAMGETMPLGNLHEVKQTNALDFFSIVQETIIMQRERKKQLNS